MRIALWHKYFETRTGGIETWLREFAASAQRFHEVHVLCSADGLPAGVEASSGLKVARHPDLSSRTGWRWTTPLLEEWQLRRWLRLDTSWQGQPDICIARHPVYALVASDVLGCPVIYVQATAMGRYEALRREGEGGLRRRAGTLLAWDFERVERRAMEAASQIVVLSRARREELLSVYGSSFAEKMRVVPAGIDATRVRYREPKSHTELRRRLGLSAEALLVCCVARLSPEKNVQLLVEAVARMPAGKVHLVVVGDGREREGLEQRAGTLRCQTHVSFVGEQRNPTWWIAESDLFALPSTYEGFGHVYLEAFAVGRACLALKPDIPRVRVATDELIVDGVDGILIANDVDEMAAALSKAAEHRGELWKMGRLGRARVERDFSWDACVKQVCAAATRKSGNERSTHA